MKTITLSDKQYTLNPVDESLARKYVDWAKTQLADPILSLVDTLKILPKDLAEIAIREAIAEKRKPLTIDDPAVTALMKTFEGAEKLIALVWEKNNLPMPQVWDLHKEAEATLGQGYFA